MKVKDWKKYIYFFMMFGSIQFIILTFIAMLFYQGGTFNNPNIPGYSFFHNFFSDLGRVKAWSGKSNVISYVLFTIALTIFGISFLLYFITMPYFFVERKLEKYISIIGSILAIITGISVVGVAFTPYDVYPSAHFNFVRIAFLSLFLAMAIYTITTFINKEYPIQYKIIFLIFSLIIGIYIIIMLSYQNIGENEILMIQATSQKIVVYTWKISFLIESYGSWKLGKS